MSWFIRRRRAQLPATEQGLKDELRDWKLITIDNKEEQVSLMVRQRIRKPALPEKPRFADAIEISWPYQSTGSFPTSEDNQKQLTFERALDDLSGSNGFSELVQVTTGMGKKQWLYYSYSRERFMKELNVRLEGHERHPLTIEFFEDPEWQIWAQAVESLRESWEVSPENAERREP